MQGRNRVRRTSHYDKHNVHDHYHRGTALHNHDNDDHNNDHDDHDRGSDDYYNYDNHNPTAGLAVLLLLRIAKRERGYHDHDLGALAVHR